MPGPIVSHDLPEWLREGSSAYNLLAGPIQKTSYDSRRIPKGIFPGQKRSVFLRDTELFVAHGKEVRCADLKDIKSGWERGDVHELEAYKVLELPDLDFDISQIVKSSDGETMLVVGEYDIGICLLPAPGVLAAGPNGRKLAAKHFKLATGILSSELQERGPRILQALFHPLGARPCIVVLTDDSRIRVYEVEFNKESTVSEPAEIWDLKKMLGIERSGSYLVDDVEASSICFGGIGAIWSLFTLYVLMKNGEIYSICPFLPSKWILDSDWVEELQYELQLHQITRDSSSQEIPALDKHNSKQICYWIHEVFRQIRIQKLSAYGDEFDEDDRPRWVLPRPTLIEFDTPILQGPYLLQPAPEEVFDDEVFASDIARIGASQYSAVAVAWSTGRVDILLEFEAVSPRWQSNGLKNKKFNERSPYPILSGFESFNVGLSAENQNSTNVWPSFSVDLNFPNTLLLSHEFGVELLSLDDWMCKISKVLDEEEDEANIEAAFRSAAKTVVSRVISKPKGSPSETSQILGTGLVYDAYLGYLVLGATSSSPGFAILQWPSKFNLRLMKAKQSDVSSAPSKPSSVIQQQSNNLFDHDAHARAQQLIAEKRRKLLQYKESLDHRTVKSEVQINFDNVQIFQKFRELLGKEIDARIASALQVHTAALRQQQRFHEQIAQIRAFADKLEKREKDQGAAAERLKATQDRQEVLKTRVDAILSKLAVIGHKGGYSSTSEAEERFFEEVSGIEKIVSQIGAKEQKMREFLETLQRSGTVTVDGAKQPTKAELDKESQEQNRVDLNKLVAREHRVINDIKKRLDALDSQFGEIKLGA